VSNDNYRIIYQKGWGRR